MQKKSPWFWVFHSRDLPLFDQSCKEKKKYMYFATYTFFPCVSGNILYLTLSRWIFIVAFSSFNSAPFKQLYLNTYVTTKIHILFFLRRSGTLNYPPLCAPEKYLLNVFVHLKDIRDPPSPGYTHFLHYSSILISICGVYGVNIVLPISASWFVCKSCYLQSVH